MRTDIYALIVIYNKNCNDSVSYNCLKDIKGLHLIVCDNSTKDYQNKTAVEDDGYVYISMRGNMGLSAAYNKALVHLKDRDGWLCIFDDDTEVPDSYFKELKNHINKNEYDILLPQVLCNNGVMSPVILKKYAIKKISYLNNLDKKYIAGINSGMAIKLDKLKDYKYDEKLFLDFIDFNFILDMRHRQASIGIMETQLNQSFSVEGNDKQASKTRFKIKKKDLKHFYSKSMISKLYYFYILARMKIKLIMKFRDIKIVAW